METTIKIQNIIETLAVSYETTTENEFREVLTAVKLIVNNEATWGVILSELKVRLGK